MACGHHRDSPASSPSATRYQIDITRLSNLKTQLPPEFTTEVRPLHTISQEDVDKVSDGLKALTITPPECQPPSESVGQTVGATVASLSVTSQQYGFVVNATETPQASAAPAPVAANCRSVTAVAPDGAVSQTTVITAPRIDDATTTATHSIQTVDDAATGKTHAVDQYLYSARLDDRHIVTVTSFADPPNSKAASEEAQRLLIDVVNSIRRHE
ncbi:hypothetical protein B1R94_10220 [Mycolicibacterium litorale]|nr:hypothetical protein B1R94_10220 [Mycolicibacterium litorale]